MEILYKRTVFSDFRVIHPKFSLSENCPNTEFLLVRIQSKYGKMRTRKSSVFRHFSRSVWRSYVFLQNFRARKLDAIKVFYAGEFSFCSAVLMNTCLEELTNTKPTFNFFMMVLVSGMHPLCLLSHVRLMLGKVLLNFINLKNLTETCF